MSDLKIFETLVCNDVMDFKSYARSYVSDEFDKNDFNNKKSEISNLKARFIEHCINVGNEYGFDGRKIVVPNDIINSKSCSYFVADDEIYNRYDNLTTVKFSGDIVLLKKDNPGIVIGYPVSDDPVVIIEDKENGVAALTHCDLKGISERRPVYAVKALVAEAGSDISNLKVYISSHLKKENRDYFIKPKEIVNNPEVWHGCVHKNFCHISSNDRKLVKFINFIYDSLAYKVDFETAIINMLVRKGISLENIVVSGIDTFKSSMHFSTTRAMICNEEILDGKFLVGAYYEDTFSDCEKSPYVKSL